MMEFCYKRQLNIALICFICSSSSYKIKTKPNLILIVADDLGWNDVGFHGSKQIPTPNIDALAYSGVILNNYYVQPICTPSRSALLTGYHPVHTGLQSYTISGSAPYGLPLSLKILPEYLQSSGYITRHIGKWHLGFYHKEYTPTFRGFHSHIGYWTGRIDYYDHTSLEHNYDYWGIDFKRNMTTDYKSFNRYATDIFTEEAVKAIETHDPSSPLFLYLAHLAVHSGNDYNPLQAPAEVIKKFSYIEDKNRRTFAAMLHKLDESVGKVVQALNAKDMLSNSIIIFTTDNGGPAAGFNNNAASNWPLRGVKATLWEGGVRGAAAIWSPSLENPGRVSNDLMQITDWLPTIISATGGNVEDLPPMDGIDMWSTIKQGVPSKRHILLHNIDPKTGGTAIRFNEWKLLYKPSPYGSEWDNWFGPSGRIGAINTKEELRSEILKSVAGMSISSMNPRAFQNIKSLMTEAEVLCDPVPMNVTQSCNDVENPCLFHVLSDPCEYYDVSASHPRMVKLLQDVLLKINATTVEPLNKPADPASNPIFWNYAWTTWKDFTEGPLYPTNS